MSTSVLDVVIVGQGLAGSLLAWQLLQQNQKILLIDNDHQSGCSRTAAGLINPISGKRLTRPALLEQYSSSAIHCYNALADFFDQKFFHPRGITRLIQSDQEQQYWLKRKQDKHYQAYLGDALSADNQNLKGTVSGFSILQGGYLDISSMLDNLSNYFHQQNCLQTLQVNYDDIIIKNDSVTINGIHARRIIFCEGYKATENPWFSWLPFKPAKGEILSLKSDENITDQVINNGRWLLPTSPGHYRFGSTFQWDELNNQPTEQARETLLNALDLMINNSQRLTVTEHRAAVRPCTSDTEPFIGLHPEHHTLGIFNGFGSKGSLLIPYYSAQFTQHLTANKPIENSADIQRYPYD